MQAAEFDAYISEYEQQHRDSIRLSGEEPGYFADYKIRELARLAGLWGMTSPAILDFGSGMGSSLPGFRRWFPGNPVTSADVSGESLAFARRLHAGDEAQLLITENRIPAADHSFDLVFTACVFHHIDHDEHDHWLRELRRVTRPGGRLVIFEHNPHNPLTRHAVRTCPFDINAHLITPKQMRRSVTAAGWADAGCDYHIFFPAALAALRGLEPWLRRCGLGAQFACHARCP